jgi:hypothetical protein
LELRSVVSFCVLYNGMRARFPLDMNMRVFIMGSYPERGTRSAVVHLSHWCRGCAQPKHETVADKPDRLSR